MNDQTDEQDQTDDPQLDLEPSVTVRTPARTGAVLFQEADIRAGLALLLLVIFAVTVFVALHGAGHKNWPQFKEALGILLPAETGLLGSAVGYYYGTRKTGN